MVSSSRALFASTKATSCPAETYSKFLKAYHSCLEVATTHWHKGYELITELNNSLVSRKPAMPSLKLCLFTTSKSVSLYGLWLPCQCLAAGFFLTVQTTTTLPVVFCSSKINWGSGGNTPSGVEGQCPRGVWGSAPRGVRGQRPKCATPGNSVARIISMIFYDVKTLLLHSNIFSV